jgi:hypothetical protein
MSTKSNSKLHQTLLVVLLVITAPLWLVLAAVAMLAHGVRQVALYAIVWFWWVGPATRRVLFVYSDSPNWKEYIEQVILPRLPANSVALNWSERRRWPRFGVSTWLFRAFGGAREFNPIGLVFDRFGLVARYRFWRPFREMKHGRPEALLVLTEGFFAHLAR